MPSNLEDWKRVKALRRELIATVPRFPNDKTSLQAMQAKDVTDLLITFIGWRIRYVAQRPRKVTGRGNLADDPRTAGLKPNIDAFIAAVEAGNDLSPYLSLDPHTRGYTPAADPKTRGADTWADKDFLLNVMGLHHFHLGLTMEAAGHIARTNEVLFASVTRDRLEIIGLFDHDAFEHEDDGTMTPERVKLWRAYQAREAAGALPGQLMVGGYANLGVTLSSQPVAVVRTAQRHVKIIREIDPKLDDPAYVSTLYGASGAPAKPKLKWCYVHLDFGLCDEAAGFFGVLERGPN
jgi:hypothetical protein